MSRHDYFMKDFYLVLITAFVILTMVFREDHFIEGMLLKRIEDGTLDKIITRIKLLLNEGAL